MEPVTDIILWAIYVIFLYLNVFWLLIYFLEMNPRIPKKKLKELPHVTLVIPAHNEEKVIELTLSSAIKIDYPRKKYEIIVAVNSSTDDTIKIARRIKGDNKETKIKILDIKDKGKGIALNRALDIAKGEFFVLLDADSYVRKDALKKLLPYFRDDKKIGCVLPVMKAAEPQNFLQKLQRHEYILNIFFKRIMASLNCVHVAPGPFSVYRTKVLERLGGFAHPNLTEDLEITLRLQKHHYKIIQTTDVEVRTIVPKDLKGLYRQRNRWYKGSVFNAVGREYRGMWFNMNYGDFGFIQMPAIIIPGILAIMLLIIQSYNLIRGTYSSLFRMYAVNFDIPTLVTNFSLNFNILDGNYTRILVMVLMLTLGVLTFILSHRMLREDIFEYGVLPATVFIILFPFFLAFVWISLMFEVLFTRRIQEW